MINAKTEHHPETAPILIAQAIEIAGDMNRLAERLGCHRSRLSRLKNGQGTMDYITQVALESFIAEG